MLHWVVSRDNDSRMAGNTFPYYCGIDFVVFQDTVIINKTNNRKALSENFSGRVFFLFTGENARISWLCLLDVFIQNIYLVDQMRRRV